MGIFTKKVCGVCGRQMGMMDSGMAISLLGGQFMCPECRGKCSDMITADFCKNVTPDYIRSHIKYLEDLKVYSANNFVETDRLPDLYKMGNSGISVDAKHGWWKTHSLSEIFTFDQMGSYYVEPHEDFEWDGVIHTKFTPPRPDMKAPGNKTFYNCELYIVVANHPYGNGYKIKIQSSTSFKGVSSLKPRVVQLKEAYDEAAKYLEFLDKYKAMFSR